MIRAIVMLLDLNRSMMIVLAAILVLLFPAAEARGGFLYLLNDDLSGSRIYGFSVNETTGALAPLDGFPILPGSGGNNSIVSERMVADVANSRLYVINDGSNTVAAYSVDRATGALTLLPFSPIALGTGNWNSIAVHPSGSPLIVSNGLSNTGSLSFAVTSTTAIPAPGNPYLVGATSAFSSTFNSNGDYFYVGGNTGTVIAGFSVNTSNGALTTLPGSPFPAGGTSCIAYAMDASGRFFSVDNAFNVRIFTTADGILSPVAGNPFPSGMTQRRFGLVHPNGNFYIVAGNTGNNVGVFAITGTGGSTAVAAVSGSPFPTGATTANVIALNQSGEILFVGNRISRSVTTFSVNTATGQLTNLGSQPSNTMGTFGAINGIGYMPDAVSNATVAGKISFKSGQAAPRTLISIVSTDNEIQMSTTSNNFGYYRFPDLPTGKTYTLTPTGKGISFAPPSIEITLSADVTNANFVAAEN
jgi:6-phosphogluconolactonase